MDVQFSYKPDRLNAIVKVGVSNFFNDLYTNTYGGARLEPSITFPLRLMIFLIHLFLNSLQKYIIYFLTPLEVDCPVLAPHL